MEYFYPHIGGAETFFLNLSKELGKKHDVTIVTSRLKGTKRLEVIDGLKIVRVDVPPFARRYFFTLFCLPTLFKIAHKFDWIQTTTYNGAFPAWVVSRLFRKKITLNVLEVFGNDWFRLGEGNKFLLWLFYLYEKFVFLLPYDEYRAISNFTRKNLSQKFKIPLDKITVEYPKVDREFWDRNKYSRIRIDRVRKKLRLGKNFTYLFFGRPGISKGVEYLIQAVPQIREKIPGSKLLLILSHDPKGRYNMIRKMVEKLGINNDVIFIDPVKQEELPEYILAADCVVVPSLSEGFGYSAVEASLLGVPVVATKVGALPEVLPKSVFFIRPWSSTDIAKGVITVNGNRIRST